MIESAEDKIRKARTQLVAQHPFFATLVLSMDFREVQKGEMLCDTMGTDGKHLYYVREFVEKLSLMEVMAVLVHEAMHAALMHPFRFKEGSFRLDKANIAADLAVNGHLKREGFVMPGTPVTADEMLLEGKTGYLHDEKFYDKAFEEIYRYIPDPPECPKCGGKGEDKDGNSCSCQSDGGGQGNKPGGQKFRINGGRKGLGNDLIPNNDPSHEAEAKINVQKAVAVAKAQGKLPAGLSQIFEDMLEPKLKWYEVLKQWMKEKRKDDYDPRRYNRRMTQFGVYLPTLYSEGMGPMVVVRDTSGSCLGDQEQFLGELASIMMECNPSRLYLLDCDARVDSVMEFKANEGDLLVESAKEFHGGGGTSFKPPFKWVREQNIKPEVFVYLTDMYGDFPTKDPGYPVLWVSTSEVLEAPIGLCMPLKEGD
jgi:predicted metal-dependent peptidase